MILPYGLIIGPLVLWLIKRADHRAFDQQGAEAVNFNITVAIVLETLALLTALNEKVLTTELFIAGMAVNVLWIAAVIVAAIRASNGKRARYELAIRLIHPAPPGAFEQAERYEADV